MRISLSGLIDLSCTSALVHYFIKIIPHVPTNAFFLISKPVPQYGLVRFPEYLILHICSIGLMPSAFLDITTNHSPLKATIFVSINNICISIC
jgi:hypothetical protein